MRSLQIVFCLIVLGSFIWPAVGRAGAPKPVIGATVSEDSITFPACAAVSGHVRSKTRVSHSLVLLTWGRR